MRNIMTLTNEMHRRIQTRLDDLDLLLEEDVMELQPVVLPSLRYMTKDLPNLRITIYELRIKDTARIVAALTTALNSWPLFRYIA